MTARAVVLGLAGAALVAGVTYFNDNIMRQTLLIGNHMPHSVYGTLILFVLVVNPLLAYLRRRRAFTGTELAVALAITLSACAIPGAGFMRFFTNAVMLPQHKARNRPGWQSEDVLRMAPEYMLAGTSPAFRDDDILDPVGMCTALVRDAEGGSLSPGRRKIWESLAEEHREAIARAAGGAGAGGVPEEERERRSRRALVRGLESLIEKRELYDREAFSGVTLSAEAEEILEREAALAGRSGGEPPLRGEPGTGEASPLPGSVDHLDDRDMRALNRHLIDAAFPDDWLYPHAKRRHDELYSFLQGVSRGKEPVSVTQVPWSAWVRPLLFWVPLVVVMSAGLIGLALVVHRQWSEHEQLPYPIARFAGALLPGEGEAKGSILRDRLFLGAAAAVLIFHAVNYTDAWWPGRFVKIPTHFDFSSLQPLFPSLSGPVSRWAIFTVRFYFAVVGLAYFVASDVSLSLGIAAPLSSYVGGTLNRYGVRIGGSGLYSGSPGQTFHIGAYLGMLLTLLYTGRRYYIGVFRRALALGSRDEVGEEAVWGARVFMASAAVFTLYLVAVGVDWQLAVPYTLMSFMLFVVMSRLLAETGLFFMEPRWYPCAFLVVMFGIRAVGPTTALLMFLFSTMLLVVPREALMPFVVNSLKVLEAKKARLGRTAVWCGVAVVLALVVAVPATLMFQYGAGTHHWDAWGTGAVPRYSFDKAVEIKQRLRGQGRLEEAESVRGFGRFLALSPETRSVVGFAVGLSLALALAAARLRWTWWPVHPVVVVAFWNYPGVMFWPSFLLGWFIKKMVVKYGGQRTYKRLTPLMLGLVAGDMLGMLLPSMIGAVFYIATGKVAPAYMVMPD